MNRIIFTIDTNDFDKMSIRQKQSALKELETLTKMLKFDINLTKYNDER